MWPQHSVPYSVVYSPSFPYLSQRWKVKNKAKIISRLTCQSTETLGLWGFAKANFLILCHHIGLLYIYHYFLTLTIELLIHCKNNSLQPKSKCNFFKLVFQFGILLMLHMSTSAEFDKKHLIPISLQTWLLCSALLRWTYIKSAGMEMLDFKHLPREYYETKSGRNIQSAEVTNVATLKPDRRRLQMVSHPEGEQVWPWNLKPILCVV